MLSLRDSKEMCSTTTVRSANVEAGIAGNGALKPRHQAGTVADGRVCTP